MAEYNIMKAVEYDKLPAKLKKFYPNIEAMVDDGFWTQKKYDGCMGVATINKSGLSTMHSRTGEDYSVSCNNILQELWWKAHERYHGDWHSFVVIGEVWMPPEQALFPEISGRFRRKSVVDPELQFMAHDLLPVLMNTSESYRYRFADLCSLLPPHTEDRCHVVYTDQTERNPFQRALEWQGAGGYDGAIIRDPDAGYIVGNVKNAEIVKVKPTLSLDLKVVELTEAVGEKTGRPVYTIGVIYNGVVSEVGSGMPHVLPVDLVLGSIVEVECLGITADGRLREPRFKGVRFDKLKAD